MKWSHPRNWETYSLGRHLEITEGCQALYLGQSTCIVMCSKYPEIGLIAGLPSWPLPVNL